MEDSRLHRPSRFMGGLRLAIAIGFGALFIAGFLAYIPVHALHGDETYYIGRSMENLGFLAGQLPASSVWFSSTNHPFTAELLIGIGLLIQGQTFPPPSNPWVTNLTQAEIEGGRMVSLIVA